MSSKTYFTIGRDSKTGVFVSRSGDGVNTRVMNSSVFNTAIKRADGKFRELTSHRSGGAAATKNVGKK